MTLPPDGDLPEMEETVVIREPAVEHVASQQAAKQVRVSRFSWSPAQWVAAIVGLLFVVMGAVALLRVGLPITGETATVLAFEHTSLMGIIDVILGLIFMGLAGSAANSRRGLITIGMVCLALGLITAIEPDAIAEFTGGDPALGWLYAVIGLVSVVTAFASPTVASVRRSSSTGVVEEQI
jgi:hypothetical protein